MSFALHWNEASGFEEERTGNGVRRGGATLLVDPCTSLLLLAPVSIASFGA